MIIVQSAQRRTFPPSLFGFGVLSSAVICNRSIISSPAIAKIGEGEDRGPGALGVVKTWMSFGEHWQKSDRRLDKLSVSKLDITGSWNQIVSARRDVSQSAIFPPTNRLIDDGVNDICEGPYGNGGAGVAQRSRVRHSRMTAIAQNTTRNTLNRCPDRDTSADYRLTDIAGSKMGRDQWQPKAANVC